MLKIKYVKAKFISFTHPRDSCHLFLPFYFHPLPCEYHQEITLKLFSYIHCFIASRASQSLRPAKEDIYKKEIWEYIYRIKITWSLLHISSTIISFSSLIFSFRSSCCYWSWRRRWWWWWERNKDFSFLQKSFFCRNFNEAFFFFLWK